MRLRIAGINHNDILGANRLHAWYEHVRKLEKSTPTFVAVEFDRELFEQLRLQRPLIRRLASEAWPETNDEVLCVVEGSLVYEGDLHERVFPGVETVWLDQGRSITDPMEISDYAENRLSIYKKSTSTTKLKLEIGDVEIICRAAWKNQRVPPKRDGSCRDRKFSQKITQRVANCKSDWAIVVVGSNHASPIEGSMVSLLTDQGIACHVTELRPYHADL